VNENPKREDPTSAPAAWLRTNVGDVFTVSGVQCRLAHVNGGKRRLTLDVLGDVPMPIGRTAFAERMKSGALKKAEA